MNPILDLIGRLLLALIFLVSGIGKITGYAGTQQYMEGQGVPGMLLPLVILVEVGGAAALIVGWQTRWAALAIGAFTLVAAALFHAEFADQVQQIQFMKNLAIAGGCAIVAAHGAGALSLDGRRRAAAF